jgi:hypothetical protein
MIRGFGITRDLFERALSLPRTFPSEGKFLGSMGIPGRRRVYPRGLSWPERRVTSPFRLPCRHRSPPRPRRQTGVTPPEPRRRACNENFAEELTGSRDAYIKGETMLRESRARFLSTDRAIKRGANNSTETFIFILCFKGTIRKLPRRDGYKKNTYIYVSNSVHLFYFCVFNLISCI